MEEQKRQQPCDFFPPFFHQRNTATEPLGGFSFQLRGLFELDLLLIEMNRPNITAPYNSILGTDGRVIREDTFPNPPSSHVLWHSDVKKGRKRMVETDDPAGPHIHGYLPTCVHTHMLEALSERQRRLLAVGQTDFMVDSRMRSKTTERCSGGCFLGFTCQPCSRSSREQVSEVTLSDAVTLACL